MISGKNVSYYLCFSMVLIEIAVGIFRESTWEKSPGAATFPSTKWDKGEAYPPSVSFFRALFLSGVGGRVALRGTRIPLTSH